MQAHWRRIIVGAAFASLGLTGASQADEANPVGLFNGHDLAGWEQVNDGKFNVENGVLALDGGNGWLRSRRPYDDFDMTIEWRADAKYRDPKINYDSGLFIRSPADGKPWPAKKYQVGMAEGKEGGIGGLTDKMFPDLIHPPGEWNTYRVVASGENVAVHINGQMAFESDKATVRSGFFGLQAEGYRFEFRNASVRELGFKPAFNGKDLTGWVADGDPSKWRVDGKTLSCLTGGGWLHTNNAIRDLVVSLEFNVPAGSNSGVFLRSAPTGRQSSTGMEIQIIDDDTTVFGPLKPAQLTGSVYAVKPPTVRAFTKAGAWQHLLIYCVGERVMVWLNGRLINDVDLDKDPELARREKRGFLGFQDYKQPIEFRNVLVKVLDAKGP